MTSFYVKILK